MNVPNTASGDMTGFDYECCTDQVRVRNSYIGGNAGAAIEFLGIHGRIGNTTNSEVAGNVFIGDGNGAMLRYLSESYPTGTIRDNLYNETAGFLTTYGADFNAFTVTNNISVAAPLVSNGAHDFGGTQGLGNWSYQSSTDGSTWTDLAYDGTTHTWMPSSGASTPLVTQFDQQPDSCATCEVARTWTAPTTGTISIRGRVLKSDATGGDGVDARITKNGSTIWGPQIIAYNDQTGVETNVNGLPVAPGDVVRFEVGNVGGGDNAHDLTSWSPSIAYVEPTNTTATPEPTSSPQPTPASTVTPPTPGVTNTPTAAPPFLPSTSTPSAISPTITPAPSPTIPPSVTTATAPPLPPVATPSSIPAIPPVAPAATVVPTAVIAIDTPLDTATSTSDPPPVPVTATPSPTVTAFPPPIVTTATMPTPTVTAMAPPTGRAVMVQTSRSTVTPYKAPPRRDACPSRKPALSLNVRLAHPSLVVGDTLQAIIHTAPRAQVGMTVRVVTTRAIVIGKGKHRKHVVRTVVLYAAAGHGTANERGEFTGRVRVTYSPPKQVQAQVTVVVGKGCSVVTRTERVMIQPKPHHTRPHHAATSARQINAQNGAGGGIPREQYSAP